MKQLLAATAKQILKASKVWKGGPIFPIVSGRARIQTQAKGVQRTFKYPTGAKVPIPPPILSPELRKILKQDSRHQVFKTKYGPLSLKMLEQLGDVQYNAAIVSYLIKKQPRLEWAEMMHLRKILPSNAQLDSFAESIGTFNRIRRPGITSNKRPADIQEAEFGAMFLENGGVITARFIEELIEPAIKFHCQKFRGHGKS
ncbi:hypothetical protein TWF281_006892 [Arthrobotrys megalospora]